MPLFSRPPVYLARSCVERSDSAASQFRPRRKYVKFVASFSEKRELYDCRRAQITHLTISELGFTLQRLQFRLGNK